MKYIAGMFILCIILWITTSALYDNGIITYEWEQTLYTFITIGFISFLGRKVLNWGD